MNKYLSLYITFLKIGLFSFGGGYATISLIEQYVVDEKAYITSQNLADIITISQMTPGPIAINSATFVGFMIFGIIGSIIATISVITPQIILINIFDKYINKENKYVKNILKGINCAICAFIILIAYGLIKNSIITNPNLISIFLFIFSIFLYLRKFKVINILITNLLFTTLYLLLVNFM